jgi:hypothetical protein
VALFNAVVSGDGSGTFTRTNVFKLLAHIVAEPAVVQKPFPVADSRKNVGWIQIGDNRSDPDGTARTYWYDVEWINNVDWKSLFINGSTGIDCNRIRYHINPGYSVRVFLDT